MPFTPTRSPWSVLGAGLREMGNMVAEQAAEREERRARLAQLRAALLTNPRLRPAAPDPGPTTPALSIGDRVREALQRVKRPAGPIVTRDSAPAPRVSFEGVGDFEVLPPTFEALGRRFPETPAGEKASIAWADRYGRARFPHRYEDDIRLNGRDFPNTPEGEAAALEWRNRVSPPRVPRAPRQAAGPTRTDREAQAYADAEDLVDTLGAMPTDAQLEEIRAATGNVLSLTQLRVRARNRVSRRPGRGRSGPNSGRSSPPPPAQGGGRPQRSIPPPPPNRAEGPAVPREYTAAGAEDRAQLRRRRSLRQQELMRAGLDFQAAWEQAAREITR